MVFPAYAFDIEEQPPKEEQKEQYKRTKESLVHLHPYLLSTFFCPVLPAFLPPSPPTQHAHLLPNAGHCCYVPPRYLDLPLCSQLIHTDKMSSFENSGELVECWL